MATITDIRVAVDLFQNHKVRELMAKHGPAGVVGLLQIWLYAATRYPGGKVSLDAYETHVSKNIGEGPKIKTTLFRDLEAIGFIRVHTRSYTIKNWTARNPWVAGSPNRVKSAKKAGKMSGKSRRKSTKVKANNVKTKTNGSRTVNERQTNGSRTADEPHTIYPNGMGGSGAPSGGAAPPEEKFTREVADEWFAKMRESLAT